MKLSARLSFMDARTVLLQLLLLESISLPPVNAEQICGPIGNSNETRGTERRDQMFYLNTANPAPCTWNITSWRVCYYGPAGSTSTFSLRAYWASYAVYRRIGSGSINERYERVSEVFVALRATRLLTEIRSRRRPETTPEIDGVIKDGFNCYTDQLDNGVSQMTVQAGDLIGACVFDPIDGSLISRRQLDIVGEVSGQSLLAMGTGACSRDSIPTSVPVSQLRTINSRRLHVYANVVPFDLQGFDLTTSTSAAPTTDPTLSNNSAVEMVIIPTAVTSLKASSDQPATIIAPQTSSDSSVSTQLPATVSQPSEEMSRNRGNMKTSMSSTIVAGSIVGALLFLLALVVFIAIAILLCVKKVKGRSFSLTDNTAYTKRSTEDITDQSKPTSEVVTKVNVAYRSSLSLLAQKHDCDEKTYSGRYVIASPVLEVSRDDSVVDMKENVAYAPPSCTYVRYQSQPSDNYEHVT